MSSKQKLVGNLPYGLTFIVSAPAGTGKTTLVQMLTKEFDSVKMSISCTTRPARPYEVNGVHYFFLSDAEFNKKVQERDFLEHVTLFGYQYGTSFEHVEELKRKGFHVVLVIDTQGAVQLMGKIKATFIFLMPPSKEELIRRLRDRGTEEEIAIQKRLEWSEKEMELAKLYDYQIVNDDLNIAYQALRSIVIAEEHRVQKNI
jgi:guanylate kinase